jgi:multidrug resistance efflux pump
MDENRRQAIEKRAVIMAETRRDVDAQLAEASGRLKAQAAEARVQLEREADALGEAISERVLGRKAS